MAVVTTAATTLTSENYIGITDRAYTDGQDATVAVVGCIDRNQTGLTAGQQYFVQNDGTLALTAGTPSVVAGTAISATTGGERMRAIGDTLPRRFKAKASGAITAGKPCIVEADGDVAQVAETALTAPGFGSLSVFESAETDNISVAYDANANKTVVVYRDHGNSFYGTAVVATISGTSISFGTPVVYESANCQYN